MCACPHDMDAVPQIVALSTSKDEADPSNAPFKATLTRLLMPRPRSGETMLLRRG